MDLTKSKKEQIAEILTRRANEIAGFSSDYKRGEKHYGSVELALSREIDRLHEQPPLIAKQFEGVSKKQLTLLL